MSLSRRQKALKSILWIWFIAPPLIGLWVLFRVSPTLQVFYVYVPFSLGIALWEKRRGDGRYFVFLILLFIVFIVGACSYYAWLVFNMGDPTGNVRLTYPFR